MQKKEKSPVSPASSSVDSSEFLPISDFTTLADSAQVFSESLELLTRFAPKKSDSLRLSASFKRLKMAARSHRVEFCGTRLSFLHEVLNGSTSSSGKLYSANFCRDRLCPMCSWRRSYKIFAQVSQIMDVIQSRFRFLFLTLTIPNCRPEELSDTITYLFDSWKRFHNKNKRFQASVRGFFRVLEVTRNMEDGSFHPHFHVILAVPPEYDKFSPLYIPHSEWLSMWRKAARDDSISQVNIQFVKEKKKQQADFSISLSGAVAEVAKYTLKSSHYLFPDDSLTDSVVSVLASSLKGRRLVQYGGIFKSTAQLLKLDDVETGDFVHLDGEINSSLSYVIVNYAWSAGVYKFLNAVPFFDAT